MKRMMVVLLVVVPALVGSLSCNKNETVIDGGTNLNVPTIVSSLNAFSYSINAQQLTTTQVIPLMFNQDRLQISATVSSGATGSAVIVVRNQAQQVIHADTFRLPGMYVVVSASGVPSSVTVSLANFTGTLTYTLMGMGNFNVMTLNEFPTRTGSQWTYAVYDSLAQRRDTLVVTIFGQTVLTGNIPAWIWQLAYGSRIDTQYVSISGDTVRFYLGYSQWTQPNYLFPLWLSKVWQLVPMESTTVTQIGWVETPAGSFPNAYLVEKEWRGYNDYGTLRTWLVPNIGIVKLHRRGTSFGWANVLWELMGYRIALIE